MLQCLHGQTSLGGWQVLDAAGIHWRGILKMDTLTVSFTQPTYSGNAPQAWNGVSGFLH